MTLSEPLSITLFVGASDLFSQQATEESRIDLLIDTSYLPRLEPGDT
jgi:hypothetical protein